MLDSALKDQLKTYLTHLKTPIELVPQYNTSDTSQEMENLLEEIAMLSDQVRIGQHRGDSGRQPSFQITRQGENVGVVFAGLPMGHEFTSLVLALLHVGNHPAKISDTLKEHIKNLKGDYVFETYFSQSCQNCPDVVQALNTMAALNPNIRHTAIDGSVFPEEVKQRNIMAVPTVYLNGEVFGQGRMNLEDILVKMDSSLSDQQAQQLDEKEPYDVLVVGAGPAGAAAAVYAARKGIRVGMIGERIGGQVMDTMSIENYISVPYTEGPQFGAALQQHAQQYGVDIITNQRATQLKQDKGLSHIALKSGATLKAKSVVLAPGAQWRQIGVEGEQEYRNKGVTYCPHCDGPLFKGKRVVVIGGGNSGVEAAIDLAGLVEHVTVLEFADALRADGVLQQKLRSLPNSTVITNASTQRIVGNGQQVTELIYINREDNTQHTLPVSGVFVQIGLTPNTQWLDSVEKNSMGEIVIDMHGKTSMDGVFAAGDATTEPFKQIVVAAGGGAKAALSAFDYLMRH